LESATWRRFLSPRLGAANHHTLTSQRAEKRQRDPALRKLGSNRLLRQLVLMENLSGAFWHRTVFGKWLSFQYVLRFGGEKTPLSTLYFQ
jgi:hypothetical protein